MSARRERVAARGLFVAGTDTGVGKSVVAACVCAALSASGSRVAAYKPVVTGLVEAPGGAWPPDHDLLAAAASAGQSAGDVSPYRFDSPASPHLAAELAGVKIDRGLLVDAARRAAGGADLLVAEGVGGLMVPLSDTYLVRDLAVDLDLPVVVAARPGLGTINHALLTVSAARAAGLEVVAVVMTPWSSSPSALERSNRATVERLAGVPVSVLPATTPERLAEAGRLLPLDAWV